MHDKKPMRTRTIMGLKLRKEYCNRKEGRNKKG